MELIDVRGMSVIEYCNFVEGRAIHLGVSSLELNIEYCEIGLIDWERYERAKAELLSRVACEALERDRPERG
jgi:hypothetical protein